MKIRVTQVVEHLNDKEDRVELPAGGLGKWSWRQYECEDKSANTPNKVLDWFHRTIPVGCLDDFIFDVLDDNNALIVGEEEPEPPMKNVPRFSVQHEFDHEPTYVVDHAADPDTEEFEIVRLSPRIPMLSRRFIAERIRDMLANQHF